MEKMTFGTYREDILELCEVKFRGDLLIESGKMMGSPGCKTASNNKFFLLLHDDSLVIKLPPEEYKKALLRDDMTPFNPMNGRKPMGTWTVWTKADASDYEEEWRYVELARDYTASEPPNPKKKKKK